MNYISVQDAGQTINPLKTVKYLIVPRGIATLPRPGRRRFWNVGRPETLFFVDPSVCPSAFPFPASPSQFCATHRGFLRSLTSRRVPLPLDNRRGSQLGINLPAKKGKKGRTITSVFVPPRMKLGLRYFFCEKRKDTSKRSE